MDHAIRGGAVTRGQRGANRTRNRLSPMRAQPLAPRLTIARYFLLLPVNPGQPFIKLRSVRVHRRDLCTPDIVYIHRDIRLKRIRQLEMILKINEHGIAPQRRFIRTDRGYLHQISRVLHQLPGVAMVRMVIARPMRQNNVSIPIADLPDDLFSPPQLRLQRPIRRPQHFRSSDAQPFSRQPRFLTPNLNQPRTEVCMMPGRAISHRQELDRVPRARELSCRTAELDLAIVRMRANAKDLQEPCCAQVSNGVQF